VKLRRLLAWIILAIPLALSVAVVARVVGGWETLLTIYAAMGILYLLARLMYWALKNA
jgi:hypothetical protein